MFYIEYINLNLIEFQYQNQMMRKQGLNGGINISINETSFFIACFMVC